MSAIYVRLMCQEKYILAVAAVIVGCGGRRGLCTACTIQAAACLGSRRQAIIAVCGVLARQHRSYRAAVYLPALPGC